jgi:hypothetical protein
LERAIDGVLRTAPIKRLIEETAKLQDELVGKRVLLRLMLSEKLIGDEALKKAAEELLSRALPTEQRMEPGHHENWDKHPASLAWDKMRQKLAHDASTPLDVF